MNKIKKIKIFGTILACLLTFPFHFLYEKFHSLLNSIISPVNESIWEHMKLLFSSILISGVLQKIIIKTKKIPVNNVCISNYIAAILSIPIFLVLYLPIYVLMGKNMIITIIIMFIAIIISEIISYKIEMKKDLKLENITIILAIITYIIFYILTIHPLSIELFRDPIHNIYGIKK